MPALGQHMMLRLTDDRVIAPTVPLRRLLARVVLELGQAYGLLMFRCIDTHPHLAVLAARQQAGRFAQRLGSALVQRLRIGVPFSPTRYKPIMDQQHLYRLFYYVLDQERHHCVDLDPYHDASGLPELLGLRVGAAYLYDNMKSMLPRVDEARLRGYLGEAALAGPIGSFAPQADSAAAAAGIPDLSAGWPLAKEARIAAARVAQGLPVHKRNRHAIGRGQPHDPTPTA